MAKILPKPANSKIRFIMLEADLADGDLTQITHAISNALRPASVGRQLGSGRTVSQQGTESAATATLVEEPEADYGAENHESSDEVERTPRRSNPRRYPSPSVVDVDLNAGDCPFEKFAAEKQPRSNLKKHLLVAHWFKIHRDTAAVGADHAYTCYLKMKWSTKIGDFAQPFRDLERRGYGTMKDGSFTINHIGDDAVSKMGTA